MTSHFIEEALKIDGVKIYGPLNIKEQGAVVAINIGVEDSSEISYILDENYNICVRPGLHCAPLAHKTIGTFKQGVVRFSFGPYNTHDEIEQGIKAIRKYLKESKKGEIYMEQVQEIVEIYNVEIILGLLVAF